MAQLLDDNGPNNFTVNVGGGGTIAHNTTYKFGGCSAYFNGSSYCYIAGNPLHRPAPYYTVEMWFWLDPAQNVTTYFLEIDQGGYGYRIYMLPQSNNYLSVGAMSYNDTILKTTTGVARGAWHHVVMEVDANAKQLWMGLDGTRIGSDYDSGFIIKNTPTLPLYIGCRDNITAFHKGYMDDLRISSNRPYALHTYSSYAVPTAPVGSNANTVLYLPFNESQYALAGDLTEEARIIIREESDWSTIHNEVHASGPYEISVPNVNKKMIVSRTTEGEVQGYGNLTPKII